MSDPRKALIRRIGRHGEVNDPTTPRPLVTLEEFFEGNNDFASIGYNFYPEQPAPSEFYSLLKQIRSKPVVADVRVEISQHDDPDAWPVTDTVWIITSASSTEIHGWLGEKFAPDDLFEGLHADRRMESLEVPNGMRASGVWWD